MVLVVPRIGTYALFENPPENQYSLLGCKPLSMPPLLSSNLEFDDHKQAQAFNAGIWETILTTVAYS